MEPLALQPDRPWTPTTRSGDLQKAQQSFLSVLGKQLPSRGTTTPQERARESAIQLVSLTLIQPMLKQLRETSNAAPPFAPTQAEKQFRALADADLAQQIVNARQFPLVDRLARDLLKRGEEMAASVQGEVAASRVPPPPSPEPRIAP